MTRTRVAGCLTLFGYNAEIELWTKAGNIKVNLNKGIDIRRFDKLIADALL